MHNFPLQDFLLAYRKLLEAHRAITADDFTEDDLQSILRAVFFVLSVAKETNFSDVASRAKRCYEIMGKGGYSAPVLAHDLGELIRQVESDARFHAFFQYNDTHAEVLARVEHDWFPALHKFKSARNDIIHGADCFAQHHYTASIFHNMRAAELGLRALARDRGVEIKNKSIEYAQWQDILLETSKKVTEIVQKAKAGPAKDEALAFYNGAIAHCTALKDKYRNNVMHVRFEFGLEDADNAMFHTQQFLNGLAAKLSETQKRPIDWKF